ncbi:MULTISPECIES: hypothetical protein [Burkholderia]|uniref:Uncharacterized protein n=1 Tax=Burkholderia seminalis TaxID=488731 RepID=A0A8A8DDQ2_9BURK|nr:hypothetical protein [Burkholderia seminalis]MBN3740753.1 hypothetical protein [Burkholderia sp. Tr-20355]MCA8043733.1 hypothetical protein [Burkholderia seminalis]MCA8306113.1 hypothetical protein [Burkholderia seminalis]MCA8434501.1 hypothetical protein [Burkholderia seminalis]MDN7853201.1 hypothetical protein [Burkholderia seminalis]
MDSPLIPSAINKANSDASDKCASRDEYDALRKHGSDDIPTGTRMGTLTGERTAACRGTAE